MTKLKSKEKIAALNRILKTLDEEPVKLPEEVFMWLSERNAYRITPEDFQVLEEYRDMEIIEKYAFHDNKQIEVHKSFQYSVCTASGETIKAIYVLFYNVSEVKPFLEHLIDWLSTGWIK